MTEPTGDLQAVVHRLAGLTAAEYEDLLARSARDFAAGEGQPEPLRAYRFDGPPWIGGERDGDAGMTRDQVRSLLLAFAVAGRVVADPDGTRALARANLQRMRASASGDAAAVWLDAWKRLLDGPLPELLIALTSPSAWSRDLRQMTPFAGVLTDQERQRVLAVHRREVTGG